MTHHMNRTSKEYSSSGYQLIDDSSTTRKEKRVGLVSAVSYARLASVVRSLSQPSGAGGEGQGHLHLRGSKQE